MIHQESPQNLFRLLTCRDIDLHTLKGMVLRYWIGGHIGCSDSFNWNLYKKHTKETVNSQGREQLHALIENCAASLRLMSYQHFMIFMKGEHSSITQ